MLNPQQIKHVLHSRLPVPDVIFLDVNFCFDSLVNREDLCRDDYEVNNWFSVGSRPTISMILKILIRHKNFTIFHPPRIAKKKFFLPNL